MENKIKCKHGYCYWEPLTKEWYIDTRGEKDDEDYFNDPDCRIYGIKYCPWCGKELSKNGKTSC